MASFKKAAVAVTLGVWTSALGSAAALAFVLNRPLEPRILPEPSTAHTSVGHLLGPAPVEPLVQAPTVVRVAPPARKPPAARPATPPEPRDLGQMKCNEWRELQVGSGRVQVCD